MPDYVYSVLPVLGLGFSCFGLGYIFGFVRGRD